MTFFTSETLTWWWCVSVCCAGMSGSDTAVLLEFLNPVSTHCPLYSYLASNVSLLGEIIWIIWKYTVLEHRSILSFNYAQHLVAGSSLLACDLPSKRFSHIYTN
uniref:Uncharacterized protein n=1 Tax=Astyanax mexicanus TaxID=7994 RepID=A0A8B9L3I7_ASTMX